MNSIGKTEMIVLFRSYPLNAIHGVLDVAISPQTCTRIVPIKPKYCRILM